ncbi:Protein of unknown function (DUF3078) [Gelidibacter algens]|uniref:DUF3078 domain-containing protein n=1 Tax=Gelidibacter algens TaxID=49280 RepID=A0A1A7R1D0_9FLAO|nr:DUF3078 domain-containing protein [Gelidibacter algens]OBX25284.1 hypothetical protein A9996_10615 [Gelidibacter algens]RAJ25816.1 Protein of unknown function (DUF3078) [Gelidibacter algens]
MTKSILITLGLMMSISFGFAQTKEELQTQKKDKQAVADAAQKEANALQAQIDALPGWKRGAFGVIGGSFSNFNNWYSQGAPNNSSGNIGINLNAFANKLEDNYFWRNSLTVNLAWVKFDDKDNPNDDDSFRPTTDVFNMSSLYGRKLNDKWAASALGEYRTTLLNNFNDPGYLDLGVGFTWTPLDNLIVVIHPLNYNFVFAENDAVFESSLGAKVVADYTRQIGAVSFKSNLSAFFSYQGSDLSNWTWTNAFSYTLWKNIGVGFDFALRNNKQEALNYAFGQYNPMAVPAETEPTFDNVDNDLQTYYTLGLTYKF